MPPRTPVRQRFQRRGIQAIRNAVASIPANLTVREANYLWKRAKASGDRQLAEQLDAAIKKMADRINFGKR